MIIQNTEELEILREGGARLSEILHAVADMIAPGVLVSDLDKETEERIRAGGDIPAFLGYTPGGAPRPFPATLCVSINEQIVHGIPNEIERKLEAGDILTIDTGLRHKGLFVDMALTVAVGDVDTQTQKLIQAAYEAREAGVAVARAGNTTGDIGYAVAEVAKKYGFVTMKELGGHGVGRAIHEDPFIPNFGDRGEGDILKEGMVIAIEPIVGEGKDRMYLADDGYTYCSVDGLRTAQFEHTIVVTEKEPEILTNIH
jgi:methionyl aminopeptidase